MPIEPKLLLESAEELAKGDSELEMVIDRATDGAWISAGVRYKYQHFFTHWAV